MSPRRRERGERRAARPEVVTFEIDGFDDGAHDDGAHDDGAADDEASEDGAADDAAPEKSGPRARAGVPHRRRALVAVVAAAVVAIAGLGAVSVVAGQHAQALLVAAPGGLALLPDVPREVWSVAASDGVSGFGSTVALGDTVVLVGDDELTALDADTGQRRWRTEIEGIQVCSDAIVVGAGPSGWPLTCVAGDDASPTVTLVDESGTVVGQRTTTPRPDAQVLPLAGLMVSADRIGDPPAGGEAFEFDFEGNTHPSTLPPGRDVRVSVTDAATGEPRWARTVAYEEPDDAWRCTDWGSSSPSGDVAALDLWLGAGLVQVGGCGVDAVFTADGVRLDGPSATDDQVVPLADRTYLRSRNDDSTGLAVDESVLDAQGDVLWDVPGRLLPPLASDGSTGGTYLVQREGDLVAYDAEHEKRWSVRQGADQTFVQTADLAVVGGRGQLAAVDLATGDVRWKARATEELDTYQAFTDGSAAILSTTVMGPIEDDGTPASDDVSVGSASGDGTGPVATRLTAYDLSDGSVRWMTTVPQGTYLTSVEGNLVAVSDTSLRRLG